MRRKKISLGSLLLLGAACVIYGAHARVHAGDNIDHFASVAFNDSLAGRMGEARVR